MRAINIQDATYWTQQIKKKQISSKELIVQTVDRIKEQNQQLNAIVMIEEVKALESLEGQGHHWHKSPFAGVPTVLKVLGQQKKGWLDSSGARLFKNEHASYTSNFVKSVEEAGFIALAQSNVPEFGFKNITDPSLYGETKNPWNYDYHAGGSSGGAAAAVASGMFPLALASDGGGSIRIPASFTGLIGLKPTRGSVPIGPMNWRSWQGAAIHFALTVSMRDTKTLFQCLHSQQVAAPYIAPVSLSTNPKKRKLKIAYCETSPVSGYVSTDAKRVLAKSCQFLEEQGHELTAIDYPINGEQLIESYYAMNGAETAAMFTTIEQQRATPLTKQDMELMTWTLYQYGRHLSATDYIQALSVWDQAAADMEGLFESYDLFLSPTTADTAPRLGSEFLNQPILNTLENAESLDQNRLKKLVAEMFWKSLERTPYTQLANLTGQPAISLPVYLTSSGLPLGIQVMASKGREDLLFEIGDQFERARAFILPAHYQES